MSSLMSEIMSASEGRYLSDDESNALREYVRGFDARLAAVDEIRAKEESVCEAATRAIIRAYPDYESNHPDSYEKSKRDLALVLRYCTHALIAGSRERLDESLLVWFSTILRGLGFTQGFIRDTYGALDDALQRELEASTYAAIAPYIAHARDVLSSKASVN
ncbi:MAG: hypothetical protein AAFU77_14440 [Myxococcota bacterium]